MFAFLKHLAQRYNDWVGDRDMEITIRRHLTDNGFFWPNGKAKKRSPGRCPATGLVAGVSFRGNRQATDDAG